MIKFLNIKKKFSKKVFSLIFFPFFLSLPSYSEIVDINDPETMVKVIINEASKTMGKLVGAKEVRVQWCEGTFYNPRRNPNNATKRRNLVLRVLNSSNKISDSAFETLKSK